MAVVAAMARSDVVVFIFCVYYCIFGVSFELSEQNAVIVYLL